MLQLNFSPFPQLTAGRLVLRQLTVADADAIATLRSNSIVNQYLDRPKTTTLPEALQFIGKITNSIYNNESIYWVIALPENNQLIGTICLWNIVAEGGTAEIGYELHPDFHGKGFIVEAMKAVIDYGFNIMQLKVITAFTLAANIASIKSLEKNNFKPDTSGKHNSPGDEGNVVYVLEKIQL